MRRYGTERFRQIPLVLYVAADIILLLVFMLLQPGNSILIKMFRAGEGLLLSIVGAVMAFLVLSNAAGRVSFKENAVYQFLKQYNFAIYLFHQQVIYWVISLLNGKVSPMILALCSFITALLVSSLIAWMIGKTKGIGNRLNRMIGNNESKKT